MCLTDRTGLMVFIYVNYLDENVRGMVSKLANDVKIDGIVDSKEDYQELQ